MLETRFRERATRLRRYAAVILSAIVVVLGAGISIFASAGILASKEASVIVDEQRRDSLAKTKRDKADIERRINEAQAELQKFERLDETSAPSATTATTRQPPNPVIPVLKQRITALESRIASYQYRKNDLEAYDAELTARLQGTDKSIPPDAQLVRVVSTLSTRVGAIILLVFLVQILVPLYRYNLRLSSYYEARADALHLIIWSTSTLDAGRLEQLVRILSPDLVHFGAAPTSPIEQAAAVARQVIAAKS
jgi:hypothetical protein